MNDLEPTAVYRFYAADGTLLYVGVSVDLMTRFRSHRSSRPWQHIIRIDLVWYPDRTTALAAEAEAIRTENPSWNTPTPRPAGAPFKHRQIMADLRALIGSGDLAAGERIPSTGQLTMEYRSRFGAGPSTVRRAVGLLLESGELVGHQGVGVFVAEKGITDG